MYYWSLDMHYKHVYRPVRLIGSTTPEFYACKFCYKVAKNIDECWYYDKDTNEVVREIEN
jgi:hypothetical protein